MSNSVVRNQKAKLAADYNDLLKDLASPKMKSIGCYTLKETIGRGSYGKVKLGVHQLTCRLVAIKKINKKHAHLMAREIHHHRQLNHPNIVSLYEILSTETNIFIVSEHCPHGDLFDALARKGRFSEPHTKRWFLQLIDAIQYCHSLGIIHRDLKLENILLDEQDNVKICDFGFARQTDKNQLLKTFCGSLAYSAPEVILRQNYAGPATDVWSLGVILYSLLAGELPFDDDCESTLQRKVIHLEYTMPSYFSSEVTDLIRKILKFDPSDRLTMNQITQHPWTSHSTVYTSQALPLPSKQHEQRISDSLLEAGFDSAVVEDMRSNHFGMRGTLWQMLIKSYTPKILMSDATQADDWIGTLKSWFISSHQKPSIVSGAVQQHRFMMKTMAFDLNFNDNTTKESDSTCSSTADDEYDDDQSSTTSSPATSVTDDDQDNEKKSLSDLDQVYPTVFHRVSPMPSRVDVLAPRSSRYPIDDRQSSLRSRLGSKMIIEEEEEEEED